jgi:Tfp pilus assembly protein PilX
MDKARVQEKGIVLLIVLAAIFIVILLGNIVLGIVASQSRLTHHNVSRIRAYYACQAAMNYTLEALRAGTWVPNTAGGANKYACLNGCIDATADYTIPADSDIPYKVQVTIYPLESGINSTTKLDIKTEYTYTP